MDLMNETNTRIHVPPLSVQASDISIAGEKDGVEFAKKKILAQVEQMVPDSSSIFFFYLIRINFSESRLLLLM